MDFFKCLVHVVFASAVGATPVAIISIVNLEGVAVWEVLHEGLESFTEVAGLPVVVSEEAVTYLQEVVVLFIQHTLPPETAVM